MRLLIITQKMDSKDPVLGFVHRWVEEFAKNFTRITVMCLQKGEYELPGNVAVISLGKEKWQSRAKYIFLLFYFSIRYYNRYDAVLIHMNQEYALVAGWLWKLLGKPIYMWRNHWAGSLLTDIAALFCRKIFCTSHYSYTAKYDKTVFMPVGVDTEFFRPDQSVKRELRSVLSLGRVDPSKNVHTFISALESLKSQAVGFTASVYGNAKDPAYLDKLKGQAANAGLSDRLSFRVGVPNRDTPRVYSAHQIFVNLSPSGMYDKTIFEAMACGCFVFASNDDLRDKIDPAFAFAYNDADDLSKKIRAFLEMSPEIQRKKAANISEIVQEHSLHKLAEKLTKEIRGRN